MMDYVALRKSLGTQDRNQLAKILDGILSQLDDYQMVTAFGGYYFEQIVSGFSDERFLEELRVFYEKSRYGSFFDRKWTWTSKTYDEITPITGCWYQLMGHWLDAVCKGVDTRKRETTQSAFQLLFELLDQIMDQGIIVMHKNVGEEYIECKSDYRMVYASFQQSLLP